MDLVIVNIKRRGSNKIELLKSEMIEKFSYKYMKTIFDSYVGKDGSDNASFIAYEVVKYHTDGTIKMYRKNCFYNKFDIDSGKNSWRVMGSKFESYKKVEPPKQIGYTGFDDYLMKNKTKKNHPF